MGVCWRDGAPPCGPCEAQRSTNLPGSQQPLAVASVRARGCRPGRDRRRAHMADIDIDQLGPVDYMVVGFPADKANFSGAMADELKKLMNSGAIRVLDLVMVTKSMDGTVEAAELRDHDEGDVGELRSLEADLSLVLALEDVERVGADLEPGSTAGVLVWENTWAGPLASAIRHSGGQLISTGRIPTQALIAAVEEDREAAEAGA